MVRDPGRDDDLPRRMAVEDSQLMAVEAPAIGRLARGGFDISEIEARRAFRMCEG